MNSPSRYTSAAPETSSPARAASPTLTPFFMKAAVAKRIKHSPNLCQFGFSRQTLRQLKTAAMPRCEGPLVHRATLSHAHHHRIEIALRGDSHVAI